MKQSGFPLRRVGIVSLSLAVLLLGASCGQAAALRASSRPLAAALKDAALDESTRRFLEAARDIAEFSASTYSLTSEVAALRYLSGARSAPAWRLTVAPQRSVTARESVFFADKEAAKAARDKAERKGDAAFVEPWPTLNVFGLSPGPLVDADAALPLERLAERVNYELFYAAYGKRGAKEEREAFAAFAAEEATAAYLAARLSPASPLLGQYLAEKRDERTFAALFRDYRSRFEGLYARSPLPDDWMRIREFLAETWLTDYRANYPNRFLTNRYRDFGKTKPSDAELAAWRDPFAGRDVWLKRLAESGGDFAAFARTTLRR